MVARPLRAHLAAMLALLAIAITSPAMAGRRLALVIGNDDYRKLGSGRQLHVSVDDAATMASTLRKLGFEVAQGEDLDRAGMSRRLAELSAGVRQGDLVLVFFSGYEVLASGQAHLLPTDIEPGFMEDHDDPGARAVSERTIGDGLLSAGAGAVVLVLDVSIDRRHGPEGADTLVSPRRGMTVIRASGLGEVTLDKVGGVDFDPNSLFVRVLASELLVPGTGLREAATRTRDKVSSIARNVGVEQVPQIEPPFAAGTDPFGKGR